ncbi:MAG TPA: sensor histidine kinase [Gammaproteobacteria bacterium]|nr:sensor histidine kinase [Gammaproteobacteria bacterium]
MRGEPSRGRRASDQVFLPDFCSVRAVFVVVLVGELLAFVLVLAATPGASDFLTRLSLVSLLVQWTALASTGALCLARPAMHRLGMRQAASLSLLLVLLTCLGMSELAWRLTQWSLVSLPGTVPGHGHLIFLARTVGIGAIVSALVLRYLYVQHQWRINLRNKAEARIQALQARIRPHFLFNSMNTIAALIRGQPDTAEQAVEDLADLFRASLRDSRSQVRLSEELGICGLYERIERLRLGDRLEVEWHLGEVPEDATVPVLCLQPLIENAIYHGIEPRSRGGTVHVIGHRQGDELEIEICNPLPTGRERRRRAGNQIALDNIRQRLALVYGRRGRLLQEQGEDYYRVRLHFPYVPAEAGRRNEPQTNTGMAS